MKWTDDAVAGFYHKLSVGIGKLTDDDILEAINETRIQAGVAPITPDIAGWVSRKVRINMVLDCMVDTNFCEADKDTYWIDPAGKWKIVLT